MPSIQTDYPSLLSTVQALLPGKKVVGFDVFDTLLVRRVEPETVKSLVARRLGELLALEGRHRDPLSLYELRSRLERQLCDESQRAGLDQELDYSALLSRWVAAAGVAPKTRASLVEALRQHELALEICAQEVHPCVAPALAALKQAGRRLIFVSDFYLSIDSLWRFLRAGGIADYFQAGYASSQGMLRKASGRLFRHVLAAEGLSSSELLFVGDNLEADVRRANEQGIDAVHLLDAGEKKRRLRLDVRRSLSERNRFWRGAVAHELVVNSVRPARAVASGMGGIGREVAPAFISFAEQILERARREDFSAIYFCAREGFLFYKMARQLLRAAGTSSALHLGYLGVSRRSTFLPSLAALSLPVLRERLFTQYPQLSAAQLVQSLGLPLASTEPWLKRAGFRDLHQVEADIASSRPLQRFLATPQVKTLFLQRQKAERELLQGYLRQKGFFDHRRALLVDIGWKGTIIDNLVRATSRVKEQPEIEVTMFGAKEGTPQTLCPKQGYFFHADDQDPVANAALDNIPLFEMLATAPHGSTVGYERRGTRIQPVTRYFKEERDSWRDATGEGQRAIWDYFAEYIRVRPLLASAYEHSSDEWKPYWQDRIRRLVHYPSADEVKSFMRTQHVESFGPLAVRAFGTERPQLTAGNGRAPLARLDQLYRSVRFTVWPAGMIRRMKLGAMLPVYDLYDTWYRARRG